MPFRASKAGPGCAFRPFRPSFYDKIQIRTELTFLARTEPKDRGIAAESNLSSGFHRWAWWVRLRSMSLCMLKDLG